MVCMPARRFNLSTVPKQLGISPVVLERGQHQSAYRLYVSGSCNSAAAEYDAGLYRTVVLSRGKLVEVPDLWTVCSDNRITKKVLFNELEKRLSYSFEKCGL